MCMIIHQYELFICRKYRIYPCFQSILITVALIITALYMLKEEQRNLTTLKYIFGLAFAFILILIHSILGANCLFRILNYVFEDKNRVRTLDFFVLVFSQLHSKLFALRPRIG